MKTTHAVTICFCLLLLAVLVWQRAGDGFKPNRLFRAADSAHSAPDLDSFSEPSLGLAVLQQEAEELLLAFHENHSEAEAAHLAVLLDSPPAGPQAGPSSVNRSLGTYKRPAAPEVTALKRLAKLRAKVRDLDNDLDWKLLGVYSRNDSPREFLESYLRLVQQATECPPGVAIWTLDALECARKCGRSEEVADTLRHVIRFHPNLQIAVRMRAALEQWEAQNPPSSEISKR